MAGSVLGGSSDLFLNYCMSRQRKVVASIPIAIGTATSLTRNVMRNAQEPVFKLKKISYI